MAVSRESGYWVFFDCLCRIVYTRLPSRVSPKFLQQWQETGGTLILLGDIPEYILTRMSSGVLWWRRRMLASPQHVTSGLERTAAPIPSWCWSHSTAVCLHPHQRSQTSLRGSHHCEAMWSWCLLSRKAAILGCFVCHGHPTTIHVTSEPRKGGRHYSESPASDDRAQPLFQASGILVKRSLFHEGMSYDSHAFSAFKFQDWNSMLNMDSLPLIVDLWVNSVFHNMVFYNRDR